MVLLAVLIFTGGWRRHRLLRSMRDRYITRAFRTLPLSNVIATAWTERPYPMLPQDVIRG